MTRVAVDIGGTFTDAVVYQDGRMRTAKALSVPGEQDSSVMDVVAGAGVELGEVEDFIHGTTTALNALLERSGARLAMVVTRGFRDVYEIGRANRPEMYNIHYQRPPRLLRRRDIFEIDERVLADGAVRTELDVDAVAELATALAGNYDAVAVCFIHSFLYPDHETRARDVLADRLPGVSVVASSDITAEWREYERWSTTLVSAYVTPKIASYLGNLEERLAAGGLGTPLHVMQSNGGVMTARTGLRRAVQTLFSGPVGGTVASVEVGRDVGSDRLICVDMGGTSFDVSLVVDAQPEIESQIDLEGHPILTPSVAIHSLGAGGGSIVHVEAGGLRVGPQSAGAIPGPACYGQGGDRPTITDANVLLGRIPADARLAGTLGLDVEAAESQLEKVGVELGLDAAALAVGAIEVVNAMMADGIRELTVARGIDPRDFDLVAFGGAGPLHAASLAAELGIKRVVVPHAPGVLSALGMLHADVRHDIARSVYGRFGALDFSAVDEAFDDAEAEGMRLLAEDGVPGDAIVLRRSVDLRYVGQEYTLTVPLAGRLGPDNVEQLAADFHEAYDARYGHSNPGEAVELVSVRVGAVGARPEADLPPVAEGGLDAAPIEIRTDFGDGPQQTLLYDRTALGAGVDIPGPAVVLESGCTTLVPPGWTAVVSNQGHLVMEQSR